MKKPVNSWVCSTGIYSDIVSLWTQCSSRKLHQDIKIIDRSTAGTCPSMTHIDLFHTFSVLGHSDTLLILTHELACGLTMSTSQDTVTSDSEVLSHCQRWLTCLSKQSLGLLFLVSQKPCKQTLQGAATYGRNVSSSTKCNPVTSRWTVLRRLLLFMCTECYVCSSETRNNTN